MKVLQLGKFYPIRGGVEKVEYDLTRGLNAIGIDCEMLCAAEVGQKGSIEEDGKVITCKSWMKAAGTMIAPSMITTLWKRRKEYDVIHVHHPDPMACLALWCSRYKGKVVLHWHSDIIKQHKALMFYYPFQRWLIKRADKIIGTTPVYLMNSRYLYNAQHKTICVPIGIDPVPEVEDSKIEALREKYKGRKIIFSLGRLVPYKGYKHMINAATHLSDDYVFLIGGDGPLKSDLERRIRLNDLQNKVILLGPVTDEDLPVYYRACDLFCLSSTQKSEAFGIVQIEAMSCGKPLVATKINGSGVSWVNKEGVSGMNAEPGDPFDLANIIECVLESEESKEKFSKGSLERFQKRFTLENMIQGVMKVYKDVMSV